MFNSIPRILSLLFLLAFFSLAIYFSATKPRVVILHSYNPEYAWTRDINVGIHRIADRWTGFSVTWHYMDSSRHTGKEWLRRIGIAARRTIDRIDPDVLIAVDDPAQDLAARYYVDHPRIQVVFAGVNGEIEPYGYPGATNVTGIFERKPLLAAKELIQALEAKKPRPKRHPRVLYLFDLSPSLKQDRKLIDDYDWTPVDYAGSVMAKDFVDWQAVVRGLPERKIDYLLIANYRVLPRSEQDLSFPTPAEVMGWTEAQSSVPVIGINVFNVEDGGALAVGASPIEQGTVAAERAEVILERGIAAGTLPVLLNHHYVVAIDPRGLSRRGLELPQVYENFARATGAYIER